MARSDDFRSAKPATGLQLRSAGIPPERPGRPGDAGGGSGDGRGRTALADGSTSFNSVTDGSTRSRHLSDELPAWTA